MDLQIGLLCVIIASVSAFIIYYISLSISPSKDDSFEEAKANRRKLIKQFQDEKKVSSEKAKEKKSKKSNKKIKDAKDHNTRGTDIEITSSDQVKETQEVKREHAESTVLTETRSDKLINKIGNKKKIVQNVQEQREQVVSTQESKAAPVSTLNQEKVENLKENKKKKKKELDKKVENKSSDIKQEDAVTAPSGNSAQTVTQNEVQTVRPAVVKPSRKRRFEVTAINQIKNEKEAVNINLLVSLIQKAEISRTEIQMLIDALLNKQQEDVSEWLKGRQDPTVKLQKQLTDNESALKEEKETNVGLQAKLRVLRTELTAERAALKVAKDRITTLETELTNFTIKFTTLNQEKLKALQELSKVSKNEEFLLKTKEECTIKERMLKEEHQQEVRALESKLNNISTQFKQHEDIIQEYEKIQEEARMAFDGLQIHLTELQAELKHNGRALTEATVEKENLIDANKSLCEQKEQLAVQIQNQCQEINILREKNESLAKINADNWENGFSCNNKQRIAELETRLEEKDNRLEQLKINISECYLEIAHFKSEVEISKQRNNTLRNKNWKIAEALTKAEKALQTKLRNEQNINEHKLCVKNESNVDIQKLNGTINRLMKHLCPNAEVDSKDNIDEWLANFEEAVMSRTVNSANGVNTSELQAQNNQLQALILHYKGIITDTERMLNQLQKDVEVEETHWKLKIKLLEQKLAKQQSNHNADVYLDS